MSEKLTDNSSYCVWCDFDEENCKMRKNCFERKMYEKLKMYEDLEEQELLLRLPCKVGTPVYYVHKCILPYSCLKCCAFRWYDNCYCEYKARIFKQEFDYRHLHAIGKRVFLTLKEAEVALAKMKEG